ncbi:heavy metal translocating P-type ATPase [Congregicoccus parvus]|uniref:heavy metal translocating P-type ATPase n=1 Tax=Congregicoccus parvus TaxID=3081749 RepID=UPI003FA55A0A
MSECEITNHERTERTIAADPGIGHDEAAWHRGWLKIAIALVLAGQGMAFGLAANMSPPTGAAYWVLHGGLAASALAVLVLLGGPLLRESAQTLRAGRLTVDLLFLVTLSGALGVSVFSTVRGAGPVFYELAAILLAIYTTGKLLGARSRAKALQAVDELRAEHDTCVLVEADGSQRTVRSADVEQGQRILVSAGGSIGVDGIVRHGRSWVDTTPLTGEPHPIEAGPGAEVAAGMRAIDGVLTVEATVAGTKRRLDRMLAEIEQAGLRPSRIQAMADRLAGRFVPLVVATAVGTIWYWGVRGGLVPAVENGLAVLVVACPCALGLATPLGVWAGLVALGRIGIVARSGDFLEALAQVNSAVFDKTGTLFEPGARAASLRVVPQGAFSAGRMRAALALAEGGVEHPIARAVVDACASSDETEDGDGGGLELVEARVVSGRGIRARLLDASPGEAPKERDMLVGSARWLEELGIDFGAFEEPTRPASGHVLRIAIDGIAAGELVLDEAPRTRVQEVFAQLQKLGVRAEISTGDPRFPAEVWSDVPRAVGVAPEDKAERVREIRATGARVLFVGDGVNDAPALACADASIALRSGAGLARSNAMAVVAGAGLGGIPEAIRRSRRVMRAIRSNLAFAAVYNTVAMMLAAAGLINPILAALLMAGSSVIVSTRVLRA